MTDDVPPPPKAFSLFCAVLRVRGRSIRDRVTRVREDGQKVLTDSSEYRPPEEERFASRWVHGEKQPQAAETAGSEPRVGVRSTRIRVARSPSPSSRDHGCGRSDRLADPFVRVKCDDWSRSPAQEPCPEPECRQSHWPTGSNRSPGAERRLWGGPGIGRRSIAGWTRRGAEFVLFPARAGSAGTAARCQAHISDDGTDDASTLSERQRPAASPHGVADGS